MKQIIYFPLTLQKTGNGTVKSSPAGIECGSDCTENYISGTEINLTATPDAGFSFTNWSGSCIGSTNPITVKMDAAKNCVANFTAIPTYTLTVVKSGGGTVSSTPAGIQCGTDCNENYSSGTVVSLIANADSGYYFAGWGGSCSGISSVAKVTMDDSKSCTATFIDLTGCNATMLASKLSACNYSYIDCITADDPDEAACDAAKKACHTEAQTRYGLCYQLSISKEGTGNGTVQSVSGLGTPISCGSKCESRFAYEDQVTLTATADSDSEFSGWFGDCGNSNTMTTTITMDWAKTCKATFSSKTVAGIMGDVDGKGSVDLADAILTLQILSGIHTGSQTISQDADVNGDNRIGIEELIYILQKTAGLR